MVSDGIFVLSSPFMVNNCNDNCATENIVKISQLANSLKRHHLLLDGVKHVCKGNVSIN